MRVVPIFLSLLVALGGGVAADASPRRGRAPTRTAVGPGRTVTPGTVRVKPARGRLRVGLRRVGRSDRLRLLEQPGWLSGATTRARAGLRRNVSPEGARRGAVVAAPGGNHEYQFHWVRDAALVMGEVLDSIERSTGAARRSHIARYDEYVDFSAGLIATKTQGGNGEPKYNVDGSAFDEPWGRPQNDGPATRALGNLRFADILLADGPTGRATVARKLFGGKQGVIRSDLDYLMKEWRAPSYDLWEEEKGDHLYARMVTERALSRGAALARDLGDHAAAERYAAVARDVEQTFDAHWDARRGVLVASLARGRRGGIDYKRSGLDVAVILGVLHTAEQGGPIRASDDRVLSTAHALETAFRDKFPINHGRAGAVFIGRYPEDKYCGTVSCATGGNPWVLATRAMGELHFRAASELGGRPVEITKLNRGFFAAALGDAGALTIGDRLEPGSLAHRRLVSALVTRGDAYLELIHAVVPAGAVEAEQVDRATGALVGATDLTWNHASLLSAARARRQAVAAVKLERRGDGTPMARGQHRGRVKRSPLARVGDDAGGPRGRFALPLDAPEARGLREARGWARDQTRVVEAELVYTTDNWATVRRSQLGEMTGRGGPDFALDGVAPGQAFEYAIRLELAPAGTHGDDGAAETWLNNAGKNYQGVAAE